MTAIAERITAEPDDDPELLRFLRPEPTRRIVGAVLDGLATYGPFVACWLFTRYAIAVAMYIQQEAPNVGIDYRPAWAIFGIDVVPWIAVGVLPAMIIIQGVLVTRRGQSIAMRALGMKVVRTDGTRAGFVRGVLVRTVFTELPGAIPVLGWIFLIADVISLWSADRRCLHDRLSGTKVITC